MAKGEKQIKHTDEQKREIVERVCELYESQNATVESCCDSQGITYRTFYLWLAQNSELSERYKKAKSKQDESFWEEIIKPKAKTGFERLLEGEETEDLEIRDLSDKGILTGYTAQTVKRSKTLPNAPSVIFAMKGLYPDKFADRTKFEGDLNLKTDEWFTKLPLEKRLAILKIANDTTG